MNGLKFLLSRIHEFMAAPWNRLSRGPDPETGRYYTGIPKYALIPIVIGIGVLVYFAARDALGG